jgi:hypothetical protein
MTALLFKNQNVRRLYLSILVGSASLVACVATFVLPREVQRGMTVILVILSVLFAFFWCWPDTERTCSNINDFFHPSFLFVGFYIVYFVFSGVLISFFHDYRSNWVNLGSDPEITVNTVFVFGIFSVAAFGLGLRAKVLFPGKKIKALLYHPDLLRKTETKYVIALLLLIGSAATLYHLSLLGPVSFDIFRYLSPSAQRDLKIGWNNVFAMVESMLEWGALFALFFFFVNRSSIRSRSEWCKYFILIVLFLVIGALVYTITGKRSSVIPLLVLPLIWRHYLIKQIKSYYMIIYSGLIIAVIALLLMVRIIVPLAVQDIDIVNSVGGSLGEIMEFYVDSPELSTFDMVVASFLQREPLLTAMGGPFRAFFKYNIETIFLTFVPPGIWMNKPVYEDPGHVFFQILSGSKVDAGFAVTVWGTSFLFLHVAGILLGMFILGWFFRGMYQLFRPWEGKPLDVFFYAIFYWMAFQFLRFGTLGFTFINFVTSMLIGVIAALFLARNNAFYRYNVSVQ